MVYCTKCGTKNKENSVNCINCREPLMVKNSIRYERKRKENDCFGLPNGGAIVGMIFGLVIILWGLSSFLDLDLGDFLWPFIVIIFGLLMIGGALYSFRNKN